MERTDLSPVKSSHVQSRRMKSPLISQIGTQSAFHIHGCHLMPLRMSLAGGWRRYGPLVLHVGCRHLSEQVKCLLSVSTFVCGCLLQEPFRRCPILSHSLNSEIPWYLVSPSFPRHTLLYTQIFHWSLLKLQAPTLGGKKNHDFQRFKKIRSWSFRGKEIKFPASILTL